MKLFLATIIVLCSLGIEATYDAEDYFSAKQSCEIYKTEWQQHRCHSDVADLHPTGVLLLGAITFFKQPGDV